MSWLDQKYMSYLTGRLQNFKRKSGVLYNFSCPFCTDGQTHKHKARGYVYEKKGSLIYFCHNCNYSASFPKFLKRMDERLYSEYVMELLADNQEAKNDDSKFTSIIKFDNNEAFEALIKLKKISQLPPYHPAWKYINSRKIPPIYHAIFRWNPNFMEWTNTLIPGKFKKDALKHDEGRIVIPFFNKHNHFFGYTGRSLSPMAEVRYITIVLNGEELLLWGANRINYDNPIKVVEGPIDATFLNNCIALAGSNITSLTKLAERSTFILALDNEPRSKEGKTKISRAIDQGFKVVIWPETIQEKDINAMVLAGYSPNHIEYIMMSNVFEGLEARMKLEEWSRR